MRKLHGFTAVAAVIIATFGISAHAADDPHHPADAAPTPRATSEPSPAQAGMMQGGMVGTPGMSPMVMMTRMMDMMNGSGLSIMDATDHIEGRIAYLRAELKITDDQSATWNTLAQALRANAGELVKLRTEATSANRKTARTSVERLEFEERALATRSKGLHAIAISYSPLYRALSEAQKKLADDLIAPAQDRMPMVSMMPMMMPMAGSTR
ncbi:MAG TPA: Spy/CpxP family protein refolding chaperone [Micropepsaceae bacterium]|nr:Spy/CpxP family protein refolding chaperone [Micropepsaceae bacterium]